jgi:CheY-like chemotaxis protein
MATILLIDDSKTVQKAAQMAIAKNTVFNLVVLGDVTQALTKAREVSPNLILLDHSLGPKDGYDVATDFKKDPLLKSIPVMLLVGPNMRLDPQKAMNAGLVGAISKPFTVEHLVSSLSAVLAPEEIAPVPFSIAGSVISVPDQIPPPVFTKEDLNLLKPPEFVHLKPPATLSDLTTPALTETLSREALESMTRKIIEEIVWEVVPGLAETMIKEELYRLLKS